MRSPTDHIIEKIRQNAGEIDSHRWEIFKLELWWYPETKTVEGFKITPCGSTRTKDDIKLKSTEESDIEELVAKESHSSHSPQEWELEKEEQIGRPQGSPLQKDTAPPRRDFGFASTCCVPTISQSGRHTCPPCVQEPTLHQGDCSYKDEHALQTTGGQAGSPLQDTNEGQEQRLLPTQTTGDTPSPVRKNISFNISQLLSLSHQQLRAFLCKMAGYSNRKSAKLMDIGESTLREHWEKVLKKLDTPLS